MKRSLALAAALFLAASPFAVQPVAAQQTEILNVSYDIARELFAQINPAFAEQWKAQTGEDVTIDQSHGGSSRQARAILEGLQADVVTFNQVTDVQVLHDRGNLIPADWQERLPNNASPYYSLPAFLVRPGNPKNIQDWSDLVREGVQPIFPNPKTSGNARYTYLAAFAYALEHEGGDEEKAKEFVGKLLANVPVFDTGGRAATTTFVERGIGDVLITFEAEVNNISREFGDQGFETVVPSLSVFAEFPVSIVDDVVDRKGTREVATAYLEFLYSEEGQTILAENFNRVHHPEVQARFAEQFPDVRLIEVDEVFGGWEQATQKHFADGAILDQIFVNR
jgi:sulfate/thiosulfate transport system substrate-binding protein